MTTLVSWSNPAPAAGDVVHHQQVDALASQFPPGPARPGRRSRPAKPTSTWPLGRAALSAARMSGVGSRTSSGTPSSLVSLDDDRALGRKSATAAAITTTSVHRRTRCASPPPSPPPCRPAPSRTRPRGIAKAVAAVTSTTDAPRRAAASARACPCLPDERLDRKRTGSRGLRGCRRRSPPPADRQGPRPPPRPGAPRPTGQHARRTRARSPGAAMTAGSASRPGPRITPGQTSLLWRHHPERPGVRASPGSPAAEGCSHISRCASPDTPPPEP